MDHKIKTESTFSRRQGLWRVQQDFPPGEPGSGGWVWVPGTSCSHSRLCSLWAPSATRASRYNWFRAAHAPSWYTASLNSWCLDCSCPTFKADARSPIKGRGRRNAVLTVKAISWLPVGCVLQARLVLKTDRESTISLFYAQVKCAPRWSPSLTQLILALLHYFQKVKEGIVHKTRRNCVWPSHGHYEDKATFPLVALSLCYRQSDCPKR